jgi:cell wall-associated NlpC family hydrolase
MLGWAGGIGSGASLAKTSGITSTLGNVTGMVSSVVGLFGGSSSGGATSSQSGPARSAATSVSSGASGAAKAAVGWAEKELGVPYVWGGETPGVGFDCSGLTQWAYSKAGIKIPRTSQQQWSAFQNKSVSLNQVQQGDLVFNAGQGDGGTFSSPGHVAMMVSGSQIIEAPYTGADVRIRAYNPSEWQHAARPTGSGATGTGPGGTGGLAGSSNPSSVGGSGSGGSSGGLSSTSEAANIMAALGGSGSGSGGANGGTNGGVTTSTNGTSSGGPSGGAPSAPSNPTGNVALAKQMAAKRGWTGSNWNSLYALWMGESGFRTNATNPTSGAYGIPQALPASKMASAGADWRTNPATQETWGMDYIGGRYQTPDNAYAQWKARNPHWYGQGTRNARRGLAVVGDRGPEVVDFKGGESVAPLGQASSLLLGSRKSMGGGCVISLQFGTGSIQISGAGGSDVSHSAREFAHSVGKALSQEAIIKKIAAGVS